jgi:methyl-accepting chemotaxis protein
MKSGRLLPFAATLLALASALGSLLGLAGLASAALALAGAACALGAGLHGARRRRAESLLRSAAEAQPAAPSPPAQHAIDREEAARLEHRREAELAAERERARVHGASALRRLRFADSVLKKVPPTTEEAAFALMERLIALRNQSASAAEAAVSADRDSTNITAISSLAVGARATMAGVRAALKEMRKHDRNAATGLQSLGQELKSGIDLLAGIGEITERSRLIAFNMAIEAARIGDKGRGFKVIVGELRALNDRTADFSKQVSELLGRFKKYNESLVETAISSSLVVAEEVEKGIGEEERAIESLLGASTSCVDLSERVTESVRRMNLELDGILESLQFQDITRQMIEGALDTIREAEGDIAPLVGSPRSEERVIREEEKRQVESLRTQLIARAKTRGEKEALQEALQ